MCHIEFQFEFKTQVTNLKVFITHDCEQHKHNL